MSECLNDWTRKMDCRGPCDVVYFDFSKAFDGVEKRLFKLERYEFHPLLIKWVAPYISGRTFKAKVY